MTDAQRMELVGQWLKDLFKSKKLIFSKQLIVLS